MKAMDLSNGGTPRVFITGARCRRVASILTEGEGTQVLFVASSRGAAHAAAFYNDAGTKWDIVYESGVLYIILSKLCKRGAGTYTKVMNYLTSEAGSEGVRIVIKDVHDASLVAWCDAHHFHRVEPGYDYTWSANR